MSDPARILDGLEPLCVPIERVKSLPGNPRRGDLQAVAASIRKLGVHRAVVARKTGETDGGDPTGEVLIGNHQLAAMRHLGFARVPVVWVDEPEQVAMARSLADNRVADVASYDDGLLREMIEEVAADSALLAATGYSEKDLEIPAPKNPGPDDDDAELFGNPIWGVIVEAATEADQNAIIQEFLDRGFRVRATI